MSKIHLVKYNYEADKKVYFVDQHYEADEKVFIVKYAYEADYKAFEVKHAYEADIKVYRVKEAYEADEFKRSSKIPKSSSFYSSSVSSSTSNSSSLSDSPSSNSPSSNYSSPTSSDSSTSSSDSSSGCGSGCISKIITWFVILAIIGGVLKYFGFIDDTDSPKSEVGLIINTKALNLRTSPGTDGEIIKLMNQNDSIWQLNDSIQNSGNQTWVYVTDKKDTGWVNKTYLK
jgi:hypothetical protein